MPDTPTAQPLAALGPQRAARVLHAKAAELETVFAELAPDTRITTADLLGDVRALAADVALVAELLAAHLDGTLDTFPNVGER